MMAEQQIPRGRLRSEVDRVECVDTVRRPNDSLIVARTCTSASAACG
jgi:hypothetical protein